MAPSDNPANLINLARDQSDKGKEALADAISSMVADDGSGENQRERDLMFQIMEQIVKDTEAAVRATISTRLAKIPDAPRDLIKRLAEDDIKVALPVLTHSKVLESTDLVDIVRNRAVEHQLAVSVREDVTEDVTDALVEKGDQSVIMNLLSNPNAKISGSAMQYLVDESKRVSAYQEPILRREELDPDTAKQMYAWVSDTLREHISSTFPIDQSVLDEVLRDAIAETAAVTEGGDTSDRLAADLTEEADVTPEFLVNTLKVGHIHLFVSLFRQLTGLQKTLITKLILEPKGEGLAVACKAMDFQLIEYNEIFDLCGKARNSAKIRGDGESAAQLFSILSQEDAKNAVDAWNNGADYKSTLKQVVG